MHTPYERRSLDFQGGDCRGGTSRLACAAHLHYHLELVYMEQGENVCAVDSETYTLRTGDALVVFPNRVHRYEQSDGDRYMILIVNPDLTPELSEIFASHSPASPLIRHASDNPAIPALFETLVRQENPDMPYRGTAIKGYLLALLSELLGMMTLNGAGTGDSRTLRSIVSFCIRNSSSELSLSILEENLHLSKYYISHLFSDRLGTRFNDFVNALRVSEACRLLRTEDDMTVTEIATAVGFSTQRTFNRAFARQMGMSPRDYRKERRHGGINSMPL